MSDLDYPTNMFGTTKVGRVMIALDAIINEPDMVYAIMAKMIPVTTLLNKKAGIIEYLAISEEFDALETMEKIPVYITLIHSDGHIEFERTTFKREVPESVKDEIMKTVMEHNVNLEDFKRFVLQYDNATEEDFTTYDETFLEALLIYINRNSKNKQ